MRRLLQLLLLLVLSSSYAPSAAAQDIVELYRTRQMNARAATQLVQVMEPLPPVPVAHSADLPHLRALLSAEVVIEEPPPPPLVFHTRRVPRFARTWFEEQYADVEWAYEGGNSLAPLDTMRTSEIRARLERAFGAPTKTLGDHGSIFRLKLPEYVQFEYWFLVNGEWPVIIMDVNGPFERGIVVSGETRHRDLLTSIRDAVLAPILESDAKAPFADYFFEEEIGTWYVTGYDGESFFVDPVDPRRLTPGRPRAPEPQDGQR